MRKYVARAPAISLEDALNHVPRARRRQARRGSAIKSGRPSAQSLPGFHDNVFARLLAAKPKMDTLSRQVYPSTILSKVGITEAGEIGALSPHAIFRGPRLWLASLPTYTHLPKQVMGRFISRQPTLNQLKSQREFGDDVHRVLLNDISVLAKKYRERPPPLDRKVVCVTAPSKDPSVPGFDLSQFPFLQALELPAEIRSSRTGLHLAGFVVKYTLMYKPLTAH